jgi:hypothetical protein
MRSLHIGAVFGVALGLLSLTACGGGGASIAAPALQAPAAGFAGDAAVLNVSGEYSGTIKDTKSGKGSVKASLAQYQSAVGGNIIETFAAGRTNSALAASESGDQLKGFSARVLNVACSFSFTGKYDSKTFVLSGSYRAVHGCTGESGTYSMKAKCSYAAAEAIRPQTGPKPC